MKRKGECPHRFSHAAVCPVFLYFLLCLAVNWVVVAPWDMWCNDVAYKSINVAFTRYTGDRNKRAIYLIFPSLLPFVSSIPHQGRAPPKRFPLWLWRRCFTRPFSTEPLVCVPCGSHRSSFFFCKCAGMPMVCRGCRCFSCVQIR